jgi:hypothetical protein
MVLRRRQNPAAMTPRAGRDEADEKHGQGLVGVRPDDGGRGRPERRDEDEGRI